MKTVFQHELRRGRKGLLIWAGAISFLLAVCVLLYPEMKAEMAEANELFASMGSFTAAFGMDKLNFGTLTGYYAIECGNVLGLGGAFFTALLAVGMLCKEEKDRTAEFLLTHPVSRLRILGGKLAALLVQVTVLNGIIFAVSLLSMVLVGEEIPWKPFLLLHLAYYLLQLELAGLCFGISAFLRRGSAGVGLGVAILLYAANLIANITESASFLKTLTPYGYCDGAEIVSSGSLDGGKLAVGLLIGLLGLAAALYHWPKKDIYA